MKKVIKTYERICKIEEKINEEYEDMTMRQQKAIKEKVSKAWANFNEELQTADDATITTLEVKYGLCDLRDLIEEK